ncbi:KTSC domain-containing protein [Deminuibacter soli]|uniref:KTSC domain-containing protein n=1 Tax=Deminuibacter soli TaxID=2291815 RepID=A0A3E1NNF4_9BACT|nr:KTSC domain-containing protein [Deminuibacter soli]RFM29461.1 KTSC domain-containing protein [Deminuibacter soli]
MRRRPVVSSVIQSAGYEPGSQVLEIAFVESGHVYQYLDVPGHIYSALLRAHSKGKYYNQYIKEQYAFKQVR